MPLKIFDNEYVKVVKFLRTYDIHVEEWWNVDCEIVPEFRSYEDLKFWFSEQIYDSFADNERFAYCDEPKELQKYFKQLMNGCCGSEDRIAKIDGRFCIIGCNFGH